MHNWLGCLWLSQFFCQLIMDGLKQSLCDLAVLLLYLGCRGTILCIMNYELK